MYQPKHSPISQNAEQKVLPKTFSILCWNIQKTDFSNLSPHQLQQQLNLQAMHIFVLQEARIRNNQNRCLNLAFKMSPNLQTKQNVYGTITASAFQQVMQQQLITLNKELGFATHKSAMVSKFKIANGDILTLVNIHAINFVPHFIFYKELKQLFQSLENISGPMIFAGDFNTWSKRRIKTLNSFMESLGLIQAQVNDTKHIKTLNRQPLDHIFYRGLKIMQAKAIAVPSISDHNPIYAEFCI